MGCDACGRCEYWGSCAVDWVRLVPGPAGSRPPPPLGRCRVDRTRLERARAGCPGARRDPLDDRPRQCPASRDRRTRAGGGHGPRRRALRGPLAAPAPRRRGRGCRDAPSRHRPGGDGACAVDQCSRRRAAWTVVAGGDGACAVDQCSRRRAACTVGAGGDGACAVDQCSRRRPDPRGVRRRSTLWRPRGRERAPPRPAQAGRGCDRRCRRRGRRGRGRGRGLAPLRRPTSFVAPRACVPRRAGRLRAPLPRHLARAAPAARRRDPVRDRRARRPDDGDEHGVRGRRIGVDGAAAAPHARGPAHGDAARAATGRAAPSSGAQRASRTRPRSASRSATRRPRLRRTSSSTSDARPADDR